MVLAIWVGLGLATLIVIGMVIRAERRSFVARGQGRAWVVLRLASLPIALLTAAIVLLPSLAIGGPEALAVFYGLLLVAAPPPGPAEPFEVKWLPDGLVLPVRRSPLTVCQMPEPFCLDRAIEPTSR